MRGAANIPKIGMLSCLTQKDGESAQYISHCLNLDIMEFGKTPDEACGGGSPLLHRCKVGESNLIFQHSRRSQTLTTYARSCPFREEACTSTNRSTAKCF